MHVVNLGAWPRRATHRRMGQAINRLLPIQANWIYENRRTAAFSMKLFGTNTYGPFFGNPLFKIGAASEYEPAYSAAFAEIAASPTQEEITDLSFIDEFFAARVLTQINRSQRVINPRDFFCDSNVAEAAVESQGYYYKEVDPTLAPLRNDPFYCPPPASIPWPETLSIPIGSNEKSFADVFRINSWRPWGETKRASRNAATVLRALVGYPFPPPITVMPSAWYYFVQPSLSEFVHSDLEINETLARLWITIATVSTYNQVAEFIVEKLEERARRNKRKALMRTIVAAVAGFMIAAPLAAAIAPLIPAGAGVTASQVATGIVSTATKMELERERKEAAESLVKVAEQFDDDSPGFAAEANKAADTLDYLAAEAQRLAGLSEDELKAIREGKTERELTPEEVGFHPGPVFEDTSLEDILVVSGIVVGTAALFVFLR